MPTCLAGQLGVQGLREAHQELAAASRGSSGLTGARRRCPPIVAASGRSALLRRRRRRFRRLATGRGRAPLEGAAQLRERLLRVARHLPRRDSQVFGDDGHLEVQDVAQIQDPPLAFVETLRGGGQEEPGLRGVQRSVRDIPPTGRGSVRDRRPT